MGSGRDLCCTAAVLLVYQICCGGAGGSRAAERAACNRLRRDPGGEGQKLLLVQAGEQICLLGAAPGGITCLRTLNREEMGQWEQEGAPEGACQRISFQEALKSVLQQRRK